MKSAGKNFSSKDLEKVDKASLFLDKIETESLSEEEQTGLLREVKRLIMLLHKKYPVNSLISDIIISYIVSGGDIEDFIFILERLKKVHKDPELYSFMGQVYLREGHLFLAHRDLEYYCTHIKPEDLLEEVVDLYQSVKKEYESVSEQLTSQYGIDVRDQCENEYGQVLLRYGDKRDGVSHFSRLVKKRPHFLPALNNLGLCYQESGRMEQAREQFLNVLEADPHNTFAMASMARISFYRDDRQTAEQYTMQLEKDAKNGIGDYYNLLQLNAYLGNHQKIIDLYQDIAPAIHLSDNGNPIEKNAIVFFAGAAYLRIGETAAGTDLLKTISSSKSLYGQFASENITDLGRKAAEQNGPFFFSIRNMFPDFIVKSIVNSYESKQTDIIKRMLHQHKTLFSGMLPTVLESGDDIVRNFYTELYDLAGMEEWNTPLSGFMRGRHGTDTLRMKLYRIQKEKGIVDDSSPIYIDGEAAKIRRMKINDAPRNKHFTKRQQELYEAAYNVLKDQKYAAAVKKWESLYSECPNDPSIINNLALTYDALGRKEEREALFKILEDIHPDYFFLKIYTARTFLAKKQYLKVESILQELSRKEEFHSSEMRAYIRLNIDYHIVVRNFKEAETWYGIADEFLPEDGEFSDSQGRAMLKALDLFRTGMNF